jgi:hypothetical protein
MQKQKKKTWVKPKTIIIDIGKCRYCNKEMTNQESFVAFATKEKAHYSCMKSDDEQRALDKTFE